MIAIKALDNICVNFTENIYYICNSETKALTFN